MDDRTCMHCGRKEPEVVLQVHHKHYQNGKAPWDYSPSQCETLCKGCHAREHGEIMPDCEWELYGEDDLGGLYGECDCCGTSLRYVFYICHENWEPMAVGTDCCDALTGTKQATEYRKKLERKSRFLKSKRWKVGFRGLYLKQSKSLEIEIVPLKGQYLLVLNRVRGKLKFATEKDAKEYVFNMIETGDARRFAMKHPLWE